MNSTKERPIILNTQEVNAVLAGHKTQYRAMVKMPYGAPEFRGCRDSNHADATLWGWDGFEDGDVRILSETKCPLGKVGDRLWVQELHARTENENLLTRTHYYANGNLRVDLRHDAGLLTKYAAEDMPRWASRILLEITDIRIERVQDITHNDSVREAAFTFYPKQAVPPLSAFPRYWMEKHSDDAWRLNPWVWVIEFKVIKEST